jgi:sarcosine oxidase delta subunit
MQERFDRFVIECPFTFPVPEIELHVMGKLAIDRPSDIVVALSELSDDVIDELADRRAVIIG